MAQRQVIRKKILSLVFICAGFIVVTFAASFIYGVKHPESVFGEVFTPSGFVQVEKDLRTDEEKQYDALYSSLADGADYSYMNGRVNIMLLGIDESQEREGWGYFRTDTIIVLNIDFENNKAYMLSVPRDSLVWVHGYGGKARVNKAFSQGGGYNKNGFEYVMKTVSKMMGGIPISQYVCVDMEVLKDIVDRMGGVDFYVDVEVNTSDAHISTGQKHLWGYQVLAYCRQRKGSSDIARIDRQQKMLKAIFNQMKEKSLFVHFPLIYNAVAENMYTNLSVQQISALSLYAMDFDLDDLTVYTVPGDYLHIGDGSYWGIHQNELEEIIESIYGVDVSLDRYNDRRYIQSEVDRYNSAVANAKALRGKYAGYIEANRAYLTDAEVNSFYGALAEAEAIADTVSLTDPGGKADAIKSKTSAVISIYNTLSAKIAASKPVSTPTPAPSTSPTTPPTTAPTTPPTTAPTTPPTTAPTSAPTPTPTP